MEIEKSSEGMDVEFAGESKKEVQAELKELRLTLCALEELVEHFAERLLPCTASDES